VHAAATYLVRIGAATDEAQARELVGQAGLQPVGVVVW